MYAKVKCTIASGTRDAVQIRVIDHPWPEWIPLSLIHGADELKLRKAMRGDEITLRIMEWKVAELGL